MPQLKSHFNIVTCPRSHDLCMSSENVLSREVHVRSTAHNSRVIYTWYIILGSQESTSTIFILLLASGPLLI